MANKINDTEKYPNTTPVRADFVIGTDVSNTTNASGGETVTFTLGDILDVEQSSANITGGTIAGVTDLAVEDGGTGASTAAGARTNLGVDAAGTDNSTDVTLAGTGTYLSIAGQVITVDLITESDISDLGNYQVQLAEGAFVDGDKTKLDGIETGATADQTGAEIKTAYETQANTNAYTDAEKTKLSNIEASADVTDTANVTAAGALMDSEVTNLAQVKAFDSADYATEAQGSLADTATQPGDDISTLTNDAGYTTNGGLVFLSSTDISSAATVDFTAFDDTKYDAYVFYIDSMLPATDGAQASMRMSTDGGSTFVSTSVYTNPASTGTTGTGNFINLAFNVGNAAGETGFNAVIHVFTKISRPSGFTIAWHRNNTGALIDSVREQSSGAFEADLSGVNAVRFYFGSGDITSGTITMYGMVNA